VDVVGDADGGALYLLFLVLRLTPCKIR
jgi:hypothetical protein